MKIPKIYCTYTTGDGGYAEFIDDFTLTLKVKEFYLKGCSPKTTIQFKEKLNDKWKDFIVSNSSKDLYFEEYRAFEKGYIRFIPSHKKSYKRGV